MRGRNSLVLPYGNICSGIFIKRGFKIFILNIVRGVNDKSVNKYVYKN